MALSAGAPLALVAATAAIGAGAAPALQGIVTLALCNLIIVLGLQVFIGNSGIYSFGQLGFAMAGGYLAALLTVPATFSSFQTPGLPPLLAEAQLAPVPATLAAAAGCVFLALVVGVPLMRTSTVAIPISTFAFLIVAYNVVANWDRVTGGSGGLVNIPRTTTTSSAGVWAALAIVLVLGYKWSASGYRLQATREDRSAARSLGIGLMRERMVAYSLSAALCGVGGALAAQQSGVMTPETFYFAATVSTLTMLVVGSVRSVLGAVVGTLAVSAISEVLRVFEEGHSVLGLPTIGETPGLAASGLGLILLATVILLPDGLTAGREAGEIDGTKRWMKAPGRARSRNEEAPPRRPGIDGDGVLVADEIAVAFGGLQVLDGVSLTLPRGRALGLIGPNGAGKTTLVNVISGFVAADRGTVVLDDADVSGLPPERLARAGLARTFQAALPFSQLSCAEGVAVGAMGVGLGRREAVNEARALLGRLGLDAEAERPGGSLPTGRRKLLGIARALATRPKYLVLDEPAAGLNESEAAELVAALQGVIGDLGCGLLLIEHDMNVVMGLCSEVQVIDEGRTVASGTPAEVRSAPEVIECYLGSAFAAVADA